MKTGVEYAHSREKRVFDLAVAHTLRLPAAVALQALRASDLFRNTEYLRTEKRVGAFASLGDIDKIRTTNDDNEPLNTLASFMERMGIDEFAQHRQIRAGTMSMVGWRQLAPIDHVKRYAEPYTPLDIQHLSLVVPTRPGLVGTFSIESHFGDHDIVSQELQKEMEVFDVTHGSLIYDANLIVKAIAKVFRA